MDTQKENSFLHTLGIIPLPCFTCFTPTFERVYHSHGAFSVETFFGEHHRCHKQLNERGCCEFCNAAKSAHKKQNAELRAEGILSGKVKELKRFTR